MENKTTLVVQTDRSFKNKVKRYCDTNGLVIGKFVERAVMHELERAGYKDQAVQEIQEEQKNQQAETGKNPGA